MGIDGIGSKGPLPPGAPAPATGPARASEAGRPFEAQRSAPASAAAATGAALDRLKAGELDVGAYVDAKVDEATAHLSALPPARLAEIRAALRERVASDPTLVDLVRTATGATPPAVPHDD